MITPAEAPNQDAFNILLLSHVDDVDQLLKAWSGPRPLASPALRSLREATRTADRRWTKRLVAFAYTLGQHGAPWWQALEEIEEATPWADDRKITPGALRALGKAWQAGQSAFEAGTRERAAQAVRGELAAMGGETLFGIEGPLMAAAQSTEQLTSDEAVRLVVEVAHDLGLKIHSYALETAMNRATEAVAHPWAREAIDFGEGAPVDNLEGSGNDWAPGLRLPHGIRPEHNESLESSKEAARGPVVDEASFPLASVAAVVNAEQDATEWRPLDLNAPGAWPSGNVPDSVQTKSRTLRYFDFDSSVQTSPPAWLAKGLLPRTGLALLYGESGAAKTFLAVHKALCVAHGLPLFGHRTKRGAVLYIAAEAGRSVAARFKVAEQALQPAINARSLATGVRTERASVRIVTEAPNLSRDGDPSVLIRTIEQAARDFERRGERLALVVIDTWHAALGGADDNSASDTGHALTPVRNATEAAGALTLILHHPGKDLERGARGSNSLKAAMDAEIELRVPGCEGARAKTSDALRVAAVTKMRDGEAGARFSYGLRIVALGTDEDGEPWTSCVVEARDLPADDSNGLSSNDRDVLEAVKAAIALVPGGRARTEAAKGVFYNSRPEQKAEARRKAWARALPRLVEKKLIELDPHDTFVWLPLDTDLIRE